MTYVLTTLVGRATDVEIGQMTNDFLRLGGGSTTWLIDASKTTSYSPEAVASAAEHFARLARAHGLRRLVAYIEKPTVRMGASLVSMSLRAAGSPLRFDIVDTRDALEAAGRDDSVGAR